MSEGHADHKWHAEYLGLLLALLVIFSQGILRITTVPLWGHYDEPTHYEYMRYLVEDRQLPAGQPADYTILERIAATYPEAIIANCYQIDTQGSGPIKWC